MLRGILIAGLLLAGTMTQNAAAQRRAAGSADNPSQKSMEVSVIARVGDQSYTSSLPGTCAHAPTASIYDLPAALWTVRSEGSNSGEIKRLDFTLWRPKNGTADQISVSIDAGATSNRIEINPRTPPIGAATVQLEPVGPGGKFELRGKDGKGTKVNLTISCPVFSGVEAEGG